MFKGKPSKLSPDSYPHDLDRVNGCGCLVLNGKSISSMPNVPSGHLFGWYMLPAN